MMTTTREFIQVVLLLVVISKIKMNKKNPHLYLFRKEKKEDEKEHK